MSSDPFRLVHPRASRTIWQLARQLHTITAGLPSWIGQGWSQAGTEHPTGRALDIIISDKAGTLPTPQEKAVGNLIAAWLIRHADQIHIRHLIWDDRIWKRRYRGTPTEWTKLNRSGISNAHLDHVHVFLDDATGTVPTAPLVPLNLIEQEMNDMNPDEFAAAVLNFPMTANGKKQPIIQHLADSFVDTRAQSVAVTTERERDKADLAAIVKRLDRIEAKL